ncbi:uncharacterized protein LOC126284266 [Schistocerca gregaria]|uniref:uncharacterized protein LOC126284266 n=1 Tax=Schistocerca gregaria TaxID=7010 RepID=UPI00211F1D5C|nr:uncharacterized protein LOC126284266 [Schistocerca gregaria]
MQKVFISIFLVAACAGVSCAQLLCNDKCMELAAEVNNPPNNEIWVAALGRFWNAGCDYSCLYEGTWSEAGSTEEDGSAPSNERSRSRRKVARQSRHVSVQHRNN